MSHKIALSFEDGVTRFITCLDGETVASAAYRSGVNVPLDCREGACGTCKAHLESGRVRMEDYVEDALSPAEEAAGRILTCKTTALSDCVVRIPAASTLCLKTPPGPVEGRIAALEPLADSGFLLTLEGEGIGTLDFLPGQYANLGVPGTNEHRAYSFSSLVERERGRVEFLIRRVPGGLMSGYLAERARVGDVMSLRGPLGGFYLRAIGRPVLMLAGGTGLAPFLAMLERIRETGSAYPIHLVYGVNREEELAGLERLEGFTRSVPGFGFTVCLARPARPCANTGFVSDFLAPEHLHGGDVDVYLCGPPPMVEAVERVIAGRGVVPVNVHYEKFLASR